MKFIFFGTPDIAVASLEELFKNGFVPSLIVTAPDSPQGRRLIMTPPPVKTWADEHDIPTIQPITLRDAPVQERLKEEKADLFVVVAYGKLLPQAVLDIPQQGTINMHPSLLPKHRGPCPIESQILVEQDWQQVGVSTMLLDANMDHGPVFERRHSLSELEKMWPMRASELRPLLAQHGAELLVHTLQTMPTPVEQEHVAATYCKKITKADAELDLSDNAEANYRKFLAYNVWPRVFFFVERNGKQVRVVVTDATLKDGQLVIKLVIPEGKKEMEYRDFERGNE